MSATNSGTIRPKAGTEAAHEALMRDWKENIRLQIPGSVLELTGTPEDRPGEVVFVVLMQDEATYRNLASNPDQDAFYRKMTELIDGDFTWEDVEMEIMLND